MAPRQFDRYMIAIGASRHVKFRRLSIPERYAFFMGVLSIAAQSPIRGCLLVGDLNAEPEDVAAEAAVPVRVARSAMDKLRTVGVIVRDETNDCEAIHDFTDWNPEPKRDETNAERQRRYRARRNGVTDAVTSTVSNGHVTADNALEVEVEVEVTPLPPRGNRVRDKQQFDLEVQAFAKNVLGIEDEEGWRNVKGAILSGARSREDVAAWLKQWRPDVLPAEAA